MTFQPGYSQLTEFDSPTDKNGNLPKGIRVTGESKRLQDDVVHQVIKEAESSQDLANDLENTGNSGINRARCKYLFN